MAEHNFGIGEYVVCRDKGVCRIADIRRMRFGKREEQVYYVAEPVYDIHAVMYIPADAEEAGGMRHVLTAEEIHAAIDKAESCSDVWIEEPKARATFFGETLAKGDRAEILHLLKMLSLRKQETEKQKRRLYSNDARLLETVEKQITEEFAFALGLKKEEVVPYILARTEAAATL